MTEPTNAPFDGDRGVEPDPVPVLYRGVLALKMDRHRVPAILATIERYPPHLRAAADAARIRVALIGPFQDYPDYSPALRAQGFSDPDVRLAGLFVSHERTLYVRAPSPVIVAHEYAHALDLALGGGSYLSHDHPGIRRAYRAARAARRTVVRYAATALTEYFAEGMRAMAEVNDERSPWPRVSRARLKLVDPALYEILEALFASRPTVADTPRRKPARLDPGRRRYSGRVPLRPA
ncbi:MAG: hypothetical protein M3169_11340 [Candidatus Eremiobacteraeota bacterium]|nr:hypothetical protein [Candidatus Eremiobacteraeota bacterium]